MPWLLGSPQLSGFLLSSCPPGGKVSRAVWWGAAQVPCLFHKLHVLVKVRNWWLFEPREVTDNAALCIPNPNPSLFCFRLIGTDAKSIPAMLAALDFYCDMRELHRQSRALCNPLCYQGRKVDGEAHPRYAILTHHNGVPSVHPGLKKEKHWCLSPRTRYRMSWIDFPSMWSAPSASLYCSVELCALGAVLFMIPDSKSQPWLSLKGKK